MRPEVANCLPTKSANGSDDLLEINSLVVKMALPRD